LSTYELDLSKVEAVCWREICRHQLSEREMVISATIIRRSFVVGRPFVSLGAQAELATLTGISRGNVHETVARLIRGRALEVSADGRIYTFLPPSREWPWLYAPRHRTAEGRASAELLERAIDAANGTQQAELFGPGVERELAEALAIERMRAALIAHHRIAIGDGPRDFPGSVCVPKPAAYMPGSGEPTQPPGTDPAPRCGSGSEISTASAPEASEYLWNAPPGPSVVPESGTGGSRIGNTPLSALNASVFSTEPQKALKTLSALSGTFPNRERWWPDTPLDPGATEDEIVAFLRIVLGERVMEDWGGWWRANAIRVHRRAVLEAISQLKLRIETKGEPTSRGAWLRDQFGRFLRAFVANERLRAQQQPKPPTQ